jgi:3-methyl-2-oxobutanoate hydroxymethyltransferase
MTDTSLYGGVSSRRITIRDLQSAKDSGERWPMLTAYDYSTARVFDEAGVPVLLVGDSAANVVYGYDTTVPVTVDELLPLVRGVVRGAKRALVVADLPFGSYQASPQQALETASRFMKEGGAQAVKIEGGQRVARQVELLVSAGIPVMAHIGLTPQSVNALGGYRVQGRGDEGAHRLVQDAKALQQAGAFAVVLEVVPSEVAAEVTRTLTIPTVGIGAGPACDAQVLVGQVREAVRRCRRRAAGRGHPLRGRGAGRQLPRGGTRVPLSSPARVGRCACTWSTRSPTRPSVAIRPGSSCWTPRPIRPGCSRSPRR